MPQIQSITEAVSLPVPTLASTNMPVIPMNSAYDPQAALHHGLVLDEPKCLLPMDLAKLGMHARVQSFQMATFIRRKPRLRTLVRTVVPARSVAPA